MIRYVDLRVRSKGPVNSSKALGATGSVGVEGLRLEV